MGVELVLFSVDTNLLPIPTGNGIPSPGQIRQNAQFRRTYSSNSIKVRNVEVGPGSFDKIKLIGKGDVGKVYLVREKKSNRLYAMKAARATQVTQAPPQGTQGALAGASSVVIPTASPQLVASQPPDGARRTDSGHRYHP